MMIVDDAASPSAEADGVRLKTENWLLSAVVVAFLAPFVAWCWFIYPTADDLSYVNWEFSLAGLGELLAGFYTRINGLYLSVFARWLHAHLTANGLYALSPAIPLVLHLAAGMAAFRLAVARRLSMWRLALCGALWFMVYVSTMPSPAGSLYWATGMVVYEPGNAMSLLLAAICLVDQPLARQWLRLAPFVLVCLLCGSHFPYIFWALAMSLERTINSPNRRYWAVVFGTALLFGSFAILAPGNFVRQSGGGEASHSIAFLAMAGVKSLFSVAAFLGHELTSAVTWFVAGVFTLLYDRGLLTARHRPTTPWQSLAAISLWLGTIFGVFLLSAIGGIDPPFPRTLNGLHSLFLCGLAFVASPLIQKYLAPWLLRIPSPTQESLLRSCAAVLIGCGFLSQNYNDAVRYLLSSAANYHQHWVEMGHRAATCRESRCVSVEFPIEPSERPPTVYHPSHLAEEPDRWPNPNYAKYFGIAEVRGVNSNDND